MIPRTAQPYRTSFTVSRSRLVSLALVGLFVCVTGCQSYKQIELSEVADHGKVRVTMTDGERATIRDPRVEADVITGRSSETIPLDQVSKVQVLQTDWVFTGLLIGGVAIAVGRIIMVPPSTSDAT